jgi:hypothetical protein
MKVVKTVAIKGVSDIRRLPRLGKIRLGEKALAQSGKEYPKAVDYFVCPDEVKKVYGEKPRVLDIMFPVEDTNIFFPQWYKRYGASTGLICKGDGETAIMVDPETGEMQEIECCPDECEWYAKKHCRRLANLQFLLPKVPGLGVWQIDTTSFYSIVNLNSAIEMIRAVAGRIRMIPLQLVLKPQEVAPDGKKKTVYVLDLIAPFTLQKLVAVGQANAPAFLLPPVDENERPEDLYPDAVLNRKDPEPFTLDPPATKTEPTDDWYDPETEASLVKVTRPGEKKQARKKATEPVAAQVVQEPDPIDEELHRAWDILGTPPAKRNAILAKPGLDKQALLKQLNSEIDRRNAEEASPPPQPPEQPQQLFQGAFF